MYRLRSPLWTTSKRHFEAPHILFPWKSVNYSMPKDYYLKRTAPDTIGLLKSCIW